AHVRLWGPCDLGFGGAVRRRSERDRQGLWRERGFVCAIAGAGGFGIAGRVGGPLVCAEREKRGWHRRAYFVGGPSEGAVWRSGSARSRWLTGWPPEGWPRPA